MARTSTFQFCEPVTVEPFDAETLEIRCGHTKIAMSHREFAQMAKDGARLIEEAEQNERRDAASEIAARDAAA